MPAAPGSGRPSGATETTVLGPFYISDAPRYPHGANICLDGKGEPLLVRGRVTDIDGRRAIDTGTFLATHGVLHDEVLGRLRGD